MADAKEGMTTNEAGQPVSEAPDVKDIEDIGPKSPKEAVQDLIEKSKKSKKGTKKVAEKTVVGGGGEEIGKAEGFVTGGGGGTGGKSVTVSGGGSGKTAGNVEITGHETVKPQGQKDKTIDTPAEAKQAREKAADIQRQIEQRREKVQTQYQRAKNIKNPSQYEFTVAGESATYQQYKKNLRERSEKLHEQKIKMRKRISGLAPFARKEKAFFTAGEGEKEGTKRGAEMTTTREKVQQAAEEVAKETEGVKPEDIFVGKPELVDTEAKERMWEKLTGEDIPDTAAEMKKEKISRLESQIEDVKSERKKRRQTIEERKERLQDLPQGTTVELNGEVLSVSKAIKRLESKKTLMYKVGKGEEEKKVSASGLLANLRLEKGKLESRVESLRGSAYGRVALGEGSILDKLTATATTSFSPTGYSALAESVVGDRKTSTVVQQTAARRLETARKRGIGRAMLEGGAAALTSPAMLPVSLGVGAGIASGGISAVSSVSSTAGAVTGATAKAAGGFLVGMEASKIYTATEQGEEAEALARSIALSEGLAGAYLGSKFLAPEFAQGFKTAGSKLKRLPGSSRKGMFGPDLSKTVKAPKGQTFESKIVKTGGKQAFRSRMPKTVRFFKGGYKGGGTKAMLKEYWEQKMGFRKTQTKPQRMTEQEFKGKEVSGGRQKLLQKQKVETEQEAEMEDLIEVKNPITGETKYLPESEAEKMVSAAETTSQSTTKTDHMIITGVPPTEKMKQKEKLSIKEYTKEAEKMGLKLKQKPDLELKQEQELKTATKSKLSTKQKQKLKTGLEGKTGLKEKEKQLLDLDVTSRLKQKERPKLKLREKVKTKQKLRQKPKQAPVVKQELALKLGLKQKMGQRQLEEQKLKMKTLQEQGIRTVPKTGGAGLFNLPAKGKVKGAETGKVGEARAEETEPLPKVDIISGSLARWQTGKFKTPAGPEARKEFKTKSPLKGFRSLEERKAGGFSVFGTKNTKEVNFY